MLSPYPWSPTSQLIKSHACFEARSNKNYQEKYTECTYKHKNHLYIFIYIYKVHSKRMGRQLCTNEAPVVNEQTNQQKTSGKSQGDEGKHEIKTKEKKRAKSDGVHGKYCDRLERLQLSGSPSLFWTKESQNQV